MWLLDPVDEPGHRVTRAQFPDDELSNRRRENMKVPRSVGSVVPRLLLGDEHNLY